MFSPKKASETMADDALANIARQLSEHKGMIERCYNTLLTKLKWEYSCNIEGNYAQIGSDCMACVYLDRDCEVGSIKYK